MSAREIALDVLLGRRDAKSALARSFASSELSERDRALALELVSGTIKMRRALTWSLAPFVRRSWSALAPALRAILLMGAYQLLCLHMPAHAVVNESVSLARKRGHAGIAAVTNAVLRKLAQSGELPPRPRPGDSIERLADYASLPDWIAAHFAERFGYERAIGIGEGLNRPARRALRVNIARWTADEARAALAQHGFEASSGAFGVAECLVLRDARGDRAWLHERVADGALAFQSEESQFAVALLAPARGETILDMCAGRGGKTALLAMRVGSGGKIHSLDDDADKLRALEQALGRAGLGPVTTHLSDARLEFPGSVPRDADAALVDAPCSGLGALGQLAESRWRKREGDPARMHRVQSAILAKAAACVRPGGRALYAACSTHPLENEAVVDAFLIAQPNFRALPIAAPAHVQWMSIGSSLLVVPGIDGNAGFFYALLEHRASR